MDRNNIVLEIDAEISTTAASAGTSLSLTSCRSRFIRQICWRRFRYHPDPNHKRVRFRHGH